ncbi:hypothetical protein QL285_054499 [Trifolium repens]|nr:hypothetical protein QL285_054499 [Trifolium repens]
MHFSNLFTRTDSGWIQLNKEEFLILRCRFLKSTAVFVTLLLFSVNQRKIKVKLSGNNAGKRRNKGGVSLYSVAGTDNDSAMLANKDMVNEPSKVVEALPPEKGQLVAVDEELQDPER